MVNKFKASLSIYLFKLHSKEKYTDRLMLNSVNISIQTSQKIAKFIQSMLYHCTSSSLQFISIWIELN